MSDVGGSKKHRTCQSAESTLLSFYKESTWIREAVKLRRDQKLADRSRQLHDGVCELSSEPLVWKSFTLHRTSGVPLVVCVRAQYQQSEMVSGYDEELRTGRLCPFPNWAQQDMVFSDSMLEGEKQPYQAQDILSACNLKKL